MIIKCRKSYNVKKEIENSAYDLSEWFVLGDVQSYHHECRRHYPEDHLSFDRNHLSDKDNMVMINSGNLHNEYEDGFYGQKILAKTKDGNFFSIYTDAEVYIVSEEGKTIDVLRP